MNAAGRSRVAVTGSPVGGVHTASIVIDPRNSARPAVSFTTVSDPSTDVYVLVTVTEVFVPAGMSTGWAGEIVVVTSTTPGIATVDGLGDRARCPGRQRRDLQWLELCSRRVGDRPGGGAVAQHVDRDRAP